MGEARQRGPREQRIAQAQLNGSGKRLALAVVERAPSPEGPWTVVKPEDVPDWVTDPDVMGSMLAGNMCRDEDPALPDPVESRPWYRAIECRRQ